METKKINWRLLASILFTLGTIILVTGQLDYESVRETFSQLSWAWVGLALFAYGLSYVLRTLRLMTILNDANVVFSRGLAVSGLYGMFNYLLPAKSGEITFIILLRKNLNLSLSMSASTLLVARYLDFAVLATILPVAVIMFWGELPGWVSTASILFSLVFLVLSATGIILYRRGPFSAGEHSQDMENVLFSRIKTLAKETINGFIDIYKQGNVAKLYFQTVLIWISIYSNFYFIILALGYKVNFFQIVVISIFMIPMTLLPIQGFANVGTHEIAWVAAFAIFGYSGETAVSVAVSSHILLLSFVLLLGAMSFVLLIPSIERSLQAANK